MSKKFSPTRLDVDAFAKSTSFQKAKAFVKYVQAISDAYASLGQGPLDETVFVKLLIDHSSVRNSFMDRILQGKSAFEQKRDAHFANELFNDVMKAVSEFRNQVSVATIQTRYELKVDPEFYGFDSNGNAFLKPEVESILEDYFSINIENEHEAKLFEMARKVVQSIEDLKRFMNDNHFKVDIDIDLVGRNGFIYEKEPNSFEVDHKVLPSWRILRSRNMNNLKTA
jgi:hypothetical protein